MTLQAPADEPDLRTLAAALKAGTYTAPGTDALVVPFTNATASPDLAALAQAAATQSMHLVLSVTLPADRDAADLLVQALHPASHEAGVTALHVTLPPGSPMPEGLARGTEPLVQAWQNEGARAPLELLAAWQPDDAHLLPTAVALLEATDAEPLGAPLTAEALEATYATRAAVLDAGLTPWIRHAEASPSAASEQALLLSPGLVQCMHAPMDADPVREALGTFRQRHPALALGTHEMVQEAPYAFYRAAQVGTEIDAVLVVVGAEGRTRLNVSRYFADDTTLRDAVTGKLVFVSFGMVNLKPDPSGLVLLETVE